METAVCHAVIVDLAVNLFLEIGSGLSHASGDYNVRVPESRTARRLCVTTPQPTTSSITETLHLASRKCCQA